VVPRHATQSGELGSDERIAGPLCPLVLSMLAARPRTTLDVADELRRHAEDVTYATAQATLARLHAAGLVHARRVPRGARFHRLTRRGRAELRVQRLIWTAAARTRTPAT
jgi:DNA-binding PadR family transcriptional regulator